MRQHMKALAEANEVRLGRAELKRQLKAGAISLAEAMEHPWTSSMHLHDLLEAQAGWGKRRTQKVLSHTSISATRRVGNLTSGERRRLCEMKGR